MKLIFRIALLATFGCSQQPAHATAAVFDADAWRVVTAPKADSDSAQCINRAPNSWMVALSPHSDSVRIVPADSPRYAHALRVAGGTLTSVSRGEFGGEIAFKPDNSPSVRISGLNLLEFLPTRKEIYGLAAWPTLGGDEGQLVRFEREPSGGWKIVSLLELGREAVAYTVLPNDTILVVTYDGAMLVHPPTFHRDLHRNTLWSMTIPTSVVRDKTGVIFIGMRMGVARLTPDGNQYREEWLMPTRCGRQCCGA
ncbi:MAG: hypothetical protein ABI852_05125 [Gemmatimonadaceae bacterium]